MANEGTGCQAAEGTIILEEPLETRLARGDLPRFSADVTYRDADDQAPITIDRATIDNGGLRETFQQGGATLNQAQSRLERFDVDGAIDAITDNPFGVAVNLLGNAALDEAENDPADPRPHRRGGWER